MAFADPDRVRKILSEAGFVDVEIDPVERPLQVGGNLEQAVHHMLQVGPAARLLQDEPAEVTEKVASALREELQAHAGADGVFIDSATWMVSGRPA